MNKFMLISTSLLLSSCKSALFDTNNTPTPNSWTLYQSSIAQNAQMQDLRKWWKKFNDPTLEKLIVTAFVNSPERNIAESRILEARGIRRTTRSFLFPQVDASADAGRQDTGLAKANNFYEARFDASYEVDLFGKNRKATEAANQNIKSLEAQYYNISLSIIAEISRDYIDYRRFQKQTEIAINNLELQRKTLELVKNQKKFGEAPQLDVERAENLVNTTQASIPEFKRLADNARLRLSILTGKLPEELQPILQDTAPIPDMSVSPVLMAPADVIRLRPDVRAASANLKASTALSESAIASLFPSFNISGFYGVAESALVNSTSIWGVAMGAAVSLIDFGRIEGQIDAARAVEKRAFEAYRLAILTAATEVETALTDYARLNEQAVYIQNAYNNAYKALNLSQILYREGEVSFINVLDSQKTLNTAEAALANIQAEQSLSLVRLYKSLGVY